MIEPRTIGAGAYSFLARSIDGGRTFGAAGPALRRAVRRGGPGPRRPRRARRRPDHHRAPACSRPTARSASAPGSAARPLPRGRVHRHRLQRPGGARRRLGRRTSPTPSGSRRAAIPTTRPRWQPDRPAPARPRARGRRPARAASPRCSSRSAPGKNLFVQRLEGAGWSPPVRDRRRRHQQRVPAHEQRQGPADGGDHHSAPTTSMYATSTDGGVLWSSLVNAGNYGAELPDALEVATNASGAGAAVVDALARRQGASASRASRRAAAPVARRRIRGARVQVRSICDDGELSLVVEAARGTRRVAPAAVLRRARFGRTRAARARLPHALPRPLRAAPPPRAHPRAGDPAPRQGPHAAPARARCRATR